MMLNIIPIPAFNDNYIWLLINPANNYCAIIDPGTTDSLIPFLLEQQLQPIAILLTHHHWDHIGGVNSLLQHYSIPVYGGTAEKIPSVTHPIKENDHVLLTELNTIFAVYDIPGHTLGHVAYYAQNSLFSGDTLFTAGCGRVFEGTNQQMYKSLMKLASLPGLTQIYCGHEYTLANLAFAQVVEPDNKNITQRIIDTRRLRSKNISSVPATLELEKLTNPFLRIDQPNVIAAAQAFSQSNCSDPVEVFSIIRQWKNTWSS